MADNFNFKDITDSIRSNFERTKDDFEKAHLMRLDAFTSFHETVPKSESVAGYMLEEYLKKYIELVSGSTINNYANEVQKTLGASTKSPPVWESSLDINNVDKFLPKFPNCKGKYQDCEFDEITDEDIEKFNSFMKTKDKKNSMKFSKNTSKEDNNKFDMFLNKKDPPPLSLNIPSTSKQNLFDLPKIQTNNENRFQPSTSGFNDRQSFLNNKYQSKKFNDNQSSNSDLPYENKPLFRTAADELQIQNMKKNMGNQSHQSQQVSLNDYGMSKKSLGGRINVKRNFIPPVKKNVDEVEEQPNENLKNVDAKMIEMIKNEIMHKIQHMDWEDIAGLDYAKKIIQEAVIWPLLRPDIFTGLRKPVRGILLFGPPGTGKTLIGKCIASQSESTFFSISASSLTSKWVGEGEKMVRALFAVAVAHQPSVIFIDEVDSLLCQRSESEHESSRRIKTEFLVQLDGARTSDNERILVVGATNRPQELDEAARRRFVRRLYIPLPEFQARYKMLENLLASVHHTLTENEINEITKLTDGYSGADMEILCKEASMEPVRSIPPSQIKFFSTSQLRPIVFHDFELALKQVRCSVSQDDLKQYIDWNNIYGSSNIS